MQVIQVTQVVYFGPEIAVLQKDKSVTRCSQLYTLQPFFDESQVLRTRGRINSAKLPFSHRHPIILPPRCIFVKLYVRELPEIYFHANTKTSPERCWGTSIGLSEVLIPSLKKLSTIV